MGIEVKWRFVGEDDDPAWDYSRVLYAYLDPSKKEILYIGKSVGTTVRKRWNRSGKQGFWEDLENERGIMFHHVIVGEFYTDSETRLTRELIADVESLLIKRLQPWGNIQSRKTRISRPGMRVVCKGAWFGKKREFRDI